MAKNRRLLEEVTKLRVSFEDSSHQYSKSEEVIQGLQNEVDRQKGLNEKLENDLMSLNKGGEGDRSGTHTPAQGLAGLDIGGKGQVSWYFLRVIVEKLMTSRTDELHQPHWVRIATHPSFPSSPVNEIDSGNATQSSKRCAPSSSMLN